jgi:hypothetical protein
MGHEVSWNSGTDIAKAVLSAYNVLNDPNQCSPTAKKSIVLFTDGNATIYYPSGLQSKAAPIQTHNDFLGYKKNMLDFSHKNSVGRLLTESKILFSAITSGEGLNVRSLTIPNPLNKPPYMDFETAVAYSYMGLPPMGITIPYAGLFFRYRVRGSSSNAICCICCT